MSGMFIQGKGDILGSVIAIATDNIKVVLVDAAQWTNAKAISAATNATPIVVTVASTTGYTTGDFVTIFGVLGNLNANGRFAITVINGTTFSLQDPITGANIAGSGAYTSGGFVVSLMAGINGFLSNVDAGARKATSANLSAKTTTSPIGGVFDAGDVTFTAVAAGAACQALVGYKDTGVAGTSSLIWITDAGTGFPVTPNGGDIIAQWDNGANRIFNL